MEKVYSHQEHRKAISFFFLGFGNRKTVLMENTGGQVPAELTRWRRYFSDSENVQVVVCSTETKISLSLAEHVRKMHKSVTEVLSLPNLRGSSHLLWKVLELSFLGSHEQWITTCYIWRKMPERICTVKIWKVQEWAKVNSISYW